MLKRHGFLCVALAVVVILITHHVWGGSERAALSSAEGTRYTFQGWNEGRRVLAGPVDSQCRSDNLDLLLNERMSDLRNLGYKRDAQIVGTGESQKVFEGYLRGIPVLFSPCDGTYLDPAFVLERAVGTP